MIYTVKYIPGANRQLNDTTNVKRLRNDPNLQHNNFVNDTVSRFKKEKMLPENIVDPLLTINPRKRKFYISPKIHKPTNLVRTVISSVD